MTEQDRATAERIVGDWWVMSNPRPEAFVTRIAAAIAAARAEGHAAGLAQAVADVDADMAGRVWKRINKQALAEAEARGREIGSEIERIKSTAAMYAYRIGASASEWEAVLTDAERARLVELGALTAQV